MPIRKLRQLTLIAAFAVVGPPLVADPSSGAYLAARSAAVTGDYEAAARYYTQALASDPANPEILENASFSLMALGDIERASIVGAKLLADGHGSQVAQMAVIAQQAKEDNYADVLARILEEKGVGPLVDGLLRSWAQVGIGEVTAALENFDTVGTERGLQGFALYHKALALALVGDFEGADTIFSMPEAGALRQTRRGAIAHIEVLSQLGRKDDALKTLNQSFGTDLDPKLQAMRAALGADEVLAFSQVNDAREGMAEVFFTVASALRNEASEDYTLLYSRVAEYLDPAHVDAILLSAGLLEQLEQYELATETYKKVARDSPAFHAVELGRAEALRRSGKPDAAIEALESLAQTHGDLPLVHSSLGDAYRQMERFADAVKAYDRSLAAFEGEVSGQWFIYYARGISHERLDLWDKAEADFRKALELNPEQPQVMNYLGYSLVEKQIKLDEALDLIERAVAARPDSGYIVDSLGWVLFRLGRYNDAVGHMERATELMPIDPIVNDHLGDVYWSVGRFLEAEFQWKRALSFVDFGDASQEADPERIRRKLDVGLDKVLEEEGAPPLKLADEG
ncbi:MAG: tetratricopeptide repeat protein [Planktotalea sp.]|uniref:tetratricopeptide repeat protein n=1 Tax=Planktotalea sp. TaxID=2029877 RepID=UPI003C77DC85